MNKENIRQAEQKQFDNEVGKKYRNEHGEFATPYRLALSMANDLLNKNDVSSIIEPSCGTGSFISALIRNSKHIEITGVENNTDLYKIAESLWKDNNVTLYLNDFIEFSNQNGEKYDSLIANPPYIRHHFIDPIKKEKYKAIVKSQTGYQLSGLSGLHAYFILAGMSMVKEGGVGYWLVPSELFSVNYGQPIRSYITNETCVERIHFFDENDLKFDDALVSSCIVIIRKRLAQPSDNVIITKGDFDNPEKSINISIQKLRSLEKWQHIFEMDKEYDGLRIGDIFKINRGISTGANSFFIKHINEWKSIGISEEWLTPVVPAPRYIKEDVIESRENKWPCKYDWAMLTISSDKDIMDLPLSLRKYLSSCPEKVRKGYTLTHRKKWFSVEKKDVPPILCTYMSRNKKNPFRFIRNKTKALATTNYLCLYPINKIKKENIDLLFEKLKGISANELLISSRQYGGGLSKIEPSELKNVYFK